MPEAVDLLIIHVPKFSNYYRPYGDFMSVNLIPMATWALADLAAQKGIRTQILHLGIEWIETGVFSALEHLKDTSPRLIAIPLHWHAQSYQVLEAAREIKARHPNTFILLGGYTASFFHREILSAYPQIDGILRGDAEGPLPALIDSLSSALPLESVANLSWRKDGRVIENPLSFVASEDDIDQSSYANLRLLKGRETYIHHMGLPFIWSKTLSKKDNKRFFHLGPPLFLLNIGRGCTGNCTWCGGGARAQALIGGRKSVVFRAPEKVADTACEAAEAGYKMLHMAFDPGREGERYYRVLFPELRRRNLKMKCYFESFSLPSTAFLKAFAVTFDLKNTTIAVSPESGVERIRYRNKTFGYSNHDLLTTIGAAEKLGIRIDSFFAMGIPGEKETDLAATRDLRGMIRKKFKNIGRLWTSTITLEPAAPWHLDPGAFGIVATRKSFDDFYRASAPGGGGLGYYIPDYAENTHPMPDAGRFEQLLRETKCRSHCTFSLNPLKGSGPFMGRLNCHYMRWRTGGGIG